MQKLLLATAPANVANGPDLEIGTTQMSGVPVEFRHYENAEAPHHVVVILPEQKVAIVQDLVYNGVFFALVSMRTGSRS